ncbi:hypothetical protein ABPG72_013162 [Tetrahymena utriculariae]
MESKAKKFFVTGFGPFGDVDDNPSSQLLKSITDVEKEQLNIIDVDTLEVSMKGVQQYHNRLKNLDLIMDESCIFLHFGVRRDIQKIYLEQCSYNNANFRMRDRQNEQPKNTKISEDQELDQCNYTVVNCNQLLESNQYLKEKCTLSTDPGRFLCNYVYFKTKIEYPNCPSLFIHVPHFTTIDFETQKNILVQLIKTLQDNNQKN